MKQIVFCADGTWNHPGQAEDGRLCDTNVCRLARALLHDHAQVVCYDDGVGVGGTPLDHLTGGAFGDGLLQKIRDGYHDIARHHAAGDRIHLFGFSRGAYTARSLAGMLALCGLPGHGSDLDRATTAAFAAYREQARRTDAVDTFRRQFDAMPVQVATVGVWDTVGALGIPVDLFQGVDEALYGFLDTTLHPDIQAAYQALSIDEQRPEFRPTPWRSIPQHGQIVEQTWFAGVHCDVGGGYPGHGLSDITLRWMMRRAQARGLRLRDHAADALGVTRKNAMAPLHDSWRAWFGPRTPRTIPANAVFASSVRARYNQDTNYRPSNLPPDFPDGLPGSSFVDVLR